MRARPRRANKADARYGPHDVPIEFVNEAELAYEVDWNSIDELIDRGLTQVPVRGFPIQWYKEARKKAFDIFMDSVVTPLRAAELAISDIYQKHKYVPSYNAPLFPERLLVEGLS